MFTENEFRINNLSYTDKDFNAIYPELLDMVKKLSYKWDPTISNESDPGVILIKLNALIADKSNYNIDKNILETFPLSVTQERNARELFDSLGYSMHWYEAGTGTVRITWSGDTEYDDQGQIVTHNIPQFTMLSNTDNSLVYTIINKDSIIDTSTGSDLVLSTNKDALYVNVVQGAIVEYKINDDALINISYLDEENKLYFTDNNVAENGIFITTSDLSDSVIDYTEWKRVDNLTIQDPGTKCYKFGVDLYSDSCYIQFPNDIDTLIGNGLRIHYIVTDGANGNTPINTIENLYSNLPDTEITNDNLSISNLSAITNGSNPETINEGYLNYKKTVGTFETLVSLRDYMNAIYNLTSVDASGVENGYMVSNDIVADRTTDIQTATYIVHSEATSYDSEKEVTVLQMDEGENKLDAFDLKLSVLHYVPNPKTSAAYNDSFRLENNFEGETISPYPEPLISKVIDKEVTVDETGKIIDYRTGIIQQIDDIKSIQHNYKPLLKNRICIIKNKFPIVCKIIPQYKVTEKEVAEITNNVITTLYLNLNARKVDFGEEPVYDYIYDLIQRADPRIKSIVLDDFQYTAYAVFFYEYEEDGNLIQEGIKEVNISMPESQYIKGVLQSDGTWKSAPTNLTIKGFYQNTQAMRDATNAMGESGSGYYMITEGDEESDPGTIYRFNPQYTESAARWTEWTGQIITPNEANPAAIYSDDEYIYMLNTTTKTFNRFMSLELLSNMKAEIYAKCILAGYTQLNIPNNPVQYTANQEMRALIKDVEKVTTNVNIVISSGENGLNNSNVGEYEVKENENILLYAPNLTDYTNYSNYVKYECNLNNGTQTQQPTYSANNISFKALSGVSGFYIPSNASQVSLPTLISGKYYLVTLDGVKYVHRAYETTLEINNELTTMTYLGYVIPYSNNAVDKIIYIGDSQNVIGILSYTNDAGSRICVQSPGSHSISLTLLDNYTETIIPANTSYQLQPGQYITFFWKSSDDNNYYDYARYVEGDIINPNFELKTNIVDQSVTSKLPGDTKTGNTSRIIQSIIVGNRIIGINDYLSNLTGGQFVLSGSRSITIKRLNTINLSNDQESINFKYAYWILNNVVEEDGVKYYQLFNNSEANQSYILKSGEYLVYTNAAQSELYILGSGTLITKNGKTTPESDFYKGFNWRVPVMEYDQILEQGADALANYWVSANTIKTYSDLSITEMELLSLGKDSVIRLTSKNGESFSITISGSEYEPVDLSGFNIEYKNKTESNWHTVNEVVISNRGWQAMSSLILKCGYGVQNAQKLLPNQSIRYYTASGEEIRVIKQRKQYEDEDISTAQNPRNYLIFKTSEDSNEPEWNIQLHGNVFVNNNVSHKRFIYNGDTFYNEDNKLISVKSDLVQDSNTGYWWGKGYDSIDATGYYLHFNNYAFTIRECVSNNRRTNFYNSVHEVMRAALSRILRGDSSDYYYYTIQSLNRTYRLNQFNKGSDKGFRLYTDIAEAFENALPIESQAQFDVIDYNLKNGSDPGEDLYYQFENRIYTAVVYKGLIHDYFEFNKPDGTRGSVYVDSTFMKRPIFFSYRGSNTYYLYDGEFDPQPYILDMSSTLDDNNPNYITLNRISNNLIEMIDEIVIPITDYTNSPSYLGELQDSSTFNYSSSRVTITNDVTVFATDEDIIKVANYNYVWRNNEWVRLNESNTYSDIKSSGTVFKYYENNTWNTDGISIYSNNKINNVDQSPYAGTFDVELSQIYSNPLLIQSNPDINIEGGNQVSVVTYGVNQEPIYPTFWIYEQINPDVMHSPGSEEVTGNNKIIQNYDGSISVYFARTVSQIANIIPDNYLAYDDSTVVKRYALNGSDLFAFDAYQPGNVSVAEKLQWLADSLTYWLSEGTVFTYSAASSNLKAEVREMADVIHNRIENGMTETGKQVQTFYSMINRIIGNTYQLNSSFKPNIDPNEGYSVVEEDNNYSIQLKLPAGKYIVPIQNIGSNIAALSVRLLVRSGDLSSEQILLPMNDPSNYVTYSYESGNYDNVNHTFNTISKHFNTSFKPQMVDFISTDGVEGGNKKHIIVIRPDDSDTVFMNGSKVVFLDDAIEIEAVPNGVLNGYRIIGNSHTDTTQLSYTVNIYDSIFNNNEIYQYSFEITDNDPGSPENLYQLDVAVADNSLTPNVKVIKILPIYKYQDSKTDLSAVILNKLRELDPNNLYNQRHVVDPALEIKDPLAGASFNLTQHPYHNFTICQIENRNILQDISVINKVK